MGASISRQIAQSAILNRIKESCMYLALAALGGLGFPEVFVIVLVWALPLWILWKFYQVLSRMASELGEIKQALVERRGL